VELQEEEITLSPQQFWTFCTMELLQWLDWGHPDLEIQRLGRAEG